MVNLKIFDALGKAMAQRQQLELEYRKPGQREPELRVVDPYHLANINGEWFLFAFDHLRKDVRTFVPARIKAMKATGKTFARPQKFSLEKRLRDSFMFIPPRVNCGNPFPGIGRGLHPGKEVARFAGND